MEHRVKHLRAWRAKGGIRPWLYLPFSFLSFGMLDFFLRATYESRGAWPLWSLAPTVATLSWCLLLTGLSLVLPSVLRKFYLSLSFLFFAVLTLAHGVLQNLFRRFFMFSSLAFANDGVAFLDLSYLWLEPLLLGGLLLALTLMLCAVILAPGRGERLGKARGITGGCCLLAGLCGILCVRVFWLTPHQGLSWDNYHNPAAVYESFTDSTGALLVSGLYQYTLRDTVLLFGVDKALTDEEKAELAAFAAERRALHADNDYTGRFAGKNLLLVQLEAIDTWMLSEDYMPNLYKLKQKSMVFEEHFTPAYITAGTLNTEFMVNTSLLPATGSVSVATHERNAFPYSMANQFRAAGYAAESFHGSDGTVYNRAVLHPNLGFSHYNSAKDMGMPSYMFDHELMAGYDQMTKDDPFFSFVITYSGHGPYSRSNGIFKAHAEAAEAVAKRDEEAYVCAVGHAMETDLFVGALLEQLEEDERLENTVVAFYADHYNYYLMDDALNKELKGAENLNMLQQTDFFIYAKGEKPERVEKVTNSLDILPTLANLFSLPDDEAVYLGNDAFSSEDGAVFFSDGSFYDADGYHSAASMRKDSRHSLEIADFFRRSRLLLQGDFFAKEAPQGVFSAAAAHAPSRKPQQ